MQLHQLRYVVEVNRTGSISKAAQNLYLTQPNLSSAISDLEKELGIKIFNRTNRGVTLTETGAAFLSYAKTIIDQVSNLEQLYARQNKKTVNLRFAWSIQVANVPFQLVNWLPNDTLVNIHLMECSHLDVIRLLMRKEADIGALFIPEESISQYKRYAKKHDLNFKQLWTMRSYLIMSAKSKLASEEIIHEHMLTNDYIQMVYSSADIYDLPNSTAPKMQGNRLLERNIYFNDRATLMEILSRCPNTYLQAPCVDFGRLEQYGLVARPQSMCDDRYVKIIMYHKQPLSKELKSLLKSIDEAADMLDPRWTDLTKPQVESE